MIRRLFTMASAVSLVPCLAMIVLLIARPWTSARIRCGGCELRVRWGPGIRPLTGGMAIGLGWPYANEGDGDEPQPSGPPHTSVGDLPVIHPRFLGLSLSRGGTVTTTWLTPHRYRASGLHSLTLDFHYAAAVPLFAVLPALWILRNRKRRRGSRADASLCRQCGYDLRASKDLCPECGMPIMSNPRRQA